MPIASALVGLMLLAAEPTSYATALITLTADLATGRLDRGSLGATCPSGATR
jgi:hypothetical protein